MSGKLGPMISAGLVLAQSSKNPLPPIDTSELVENQDFPVSELLLSWKMLYELCQISQKCRCRVCREVSVLDPERSTPGQNSTA